MMFETIGQAQVFLTMVYAGLTVGLVYDVLRMLRHLTGARMWWTAVLDLLFWLGAGIIVAVALALGGEQSVRLYALGGCACGFVLYLLGISRVLRGVGSAAAAAYRRVEQTPKWQARLAAQQARQEAREAERRAAAQQRQAARAAQRQRKPDKQGKRTTQPLPDAIPRKRTAFVPRVMKKED